MDIVLYLLDRVKKSSSTAVDWRTICAKMKAADFIRSVLEFEVTGFSPAARRKVKTKMSKNKRFNTAAIMKYSVAAGPLAL